MLGLRAASSQPTLSAHREIFGVTFMIQPRYAPKARAIILTFSTAALLGISQASIAAEDCDRTCLTNLITQYVDALIVRDHSTLPLADSVRITEDSKTIKLGDGLWKTATGKGTFRHDYLDVKKQVAASHVHIYEGTNQALLAVLLHVKDKKIVGIESLIEHVTPETRFKPKVLDKLVRGMDDAVGKKQSRQSMIKTALTYTEGLRVGNFTDARTPFAAAAYRVENGVITAGEGCGRADCGLYTQNIMLHPGIVASVAAVDEENGTVLLWMNFGLTGADYGPNNALVTFEAFKVWGGEIHAINAFFRGLPMATARFWPSADPIAP
jgi:hypothetical protein